MMLRLEERPFTPDQNPGERASFYDAFPFEYHGRSRNTVNIVQYSMMETATGWPPAGRNTPMTR